MNFKNIPNKHRPIPFWSWNEKLDTKETKRQIELMSEAGIGGFFMHARGGLQTEYMEEDWFLNVSESVNKAKKLKMGAWAYDENGWPSGFGNGFVNGKGIEYQQKYLRISETEPEENVIAKCGDYWFYYKVNPFYVDTLDRNVVSEFIKYSYEPYYEKYKNDLEGFFTDEPQISRSGIPWSFVFEDEYFKRYSEDIKAVLSELFLPVGNYKNTRIKFWKMVTELFSENYMKQIYDWCDERGLKLTGHLVLEETLKTQLVTNGACMTHYEYLHIPGMDWLGRKVFRTLTEKQVSSVCEQLGKKQVLSETFAMCGHNVSFAELKGIYENQMVRGINLLCQHLEGYSLRGIRKRDYPPAMYYQQPWWTEYKTFNESMSRVGMLLSEGKSKAEVLVLHPQTTAWTLYDNDKCEGLKELNDNFLEILNSLEKKHISYHLGDEIIMERHAYVENGKLVIGNQKYDKIIVSLCDMFFENTKKLLSDFEKQGGKIVTAVEFENNNVTDCEEITYTKREFDDFTMHYFVNTSRKRKTAKINVNGKKFDITNGEFEEFYENYEFEPWGSLVVIDDGENLKLSSEIKKDFVYLPEKMTISEEVENSLTLDFCSYWFDGELQEKNGYVLNIAERANALERSVSLHQEYKVISNYIPKKLHLVCENPEKFDIKVNGKKIEKKVNGYFKDKSFEKIDISKYVQLGENIISFDCVFEQSEEFYENRRKSFVFESEKNKLVYDMEIEAVYLIGDFSVKTDGKWEQLERDAQRYYGEFEIDKPKTEISIKNMEKQGYPFFSGKIHLTGEIEINGKNPVLKLDIKGNNVIKVIINGIEKVLLWDNELPLNCFNAKGKQKIDLILYNNLRNLLGPHHLKAGEVYGVGPGNFFKEDCLWHPHAHTDWDDSYCFVEMGL